MNAERRPTRAWFSVCSIIALLALSLPFLWRTQISGFMMLGFCLAPLVLAGLVLMLVVWLIRRPRLRFWQIVLGILLIVAGVGFGLTGDSFARKTIFGMNFSSYHQFVANTLGNPPKTQKGKRAKLPDKPGLGVYETYYEVVDGKPVITIDTNCGPTLETVLFSTGQIAHYDYGKLAMVRQDDLGYWYFVERT